MLTYPGRHIRRQSYLNILGKSLPELPDAVRDRLSIQYGISPTDVETLLSMDEYEAEGIKYFEEVVKGQQPGEKHLDGKKAVNWYVNIYYGLSALNDAETSSQLSG